MKKPTIILSLFLAVLLLASCGEEEDVTPDKWVNQTEDLYKLNNNKVSITEGISGTLTLIEGNCMPIVDPNSCKEYPVKRKIVIYPYLTIKDVTSQDFVHYTVNTNPLLTVESDAEGFYQARLAPGTYSVFILENGKLYANSLDGQGGISPAQVSSNSVSKLNLRLNYAVY